MSVQRYLPVTAARTAGSSGTVAAAHADQNASSRLNSDMSVNGAHAVSTTRIGMISRLANVDTTAVPAAPIRKSTNIARTPKRQACTSCHDSCTPA